MEQRRAARSLERSVDARRPRIRPQPFSEAPQQVPHDHVVGFDGRGVNPCAVIRARQQLGDELVDAPVDLVADRTHLVERLGLGGVVEHPVLVALPGDRSGRRRRSPS